MNGGRFKGTGDGTSDGQLQFDWSAVPDGDLTGVPPVCPGTSITSPPKSDEQSEITVVSQPRRHRTSRSHVSSGGYEPGHPWYYLQAGDGKSPVPADEIPAAKNLGQYIEHELPKSGARRVARIRQLLDEERRQLVADRLRYQELVERGIEALSHYDRYSVFLGDEELEVATALSLKYNHISWHRGRVEYLVEELSKCNPRGCSR